MSEMPMHDRDVPQPGAVWQERYGLLPDSARALAEALAALPDPEALSQLLAGTLDRIVQQNVNTIQQDAGETTGEDGHQSLTASLDPTAATALARIGYAAPFLLRQMGGRPETLAMGVLQRLEDEQGAIPWHRYAQPATTPTLAEADLMSLLRRWKYDNLLRITARDLMGFQDTAATCRDISDLADSMLRIAYGHAFGDLAGRHGVPLNDEGELAVGAVIGMGKLGGRELNYASDVDLIFIQEGDDTPCRMMEDIPLPPIDLGAPEADFWDRWRVIARSAGEGSEGRIGSGEFHNRLARQVTRLLSAQQVEGFGFRVDTDLRPGGSAGFLAPNLAFMEAYYIQHGREWERTAMLKARGITGCSLLLGRFAEMIRPFVYRRYLDFGALEGIAIVKHDIDRTNRAALESNLKLGRGGIRENEFFVQALQLLYGGKRPSLQVTGHVDAVQALEESGVLESGEARSILEDYWALRTLENRIQMVEETQAHDLPGDTGDLLRITHDFQPGGEARMPEVLAGLGGVRERNGARFHELFAGLGEDSFPDANAWRGAVASHLPDAVECEGVLARVDNLFERLMRSRAGERCVFKLVKLLDREEVYQRGTAPALPRWLDFFEQIGNRNAIYVLIENHPPIVPWVTEIFTEGGRHAEVLIRHPEFLETFFALGENWDSLAAQFDDMLEGASDEEEFILELQGATSRCKLMALTFMLSDPGNGLEHEPNRELLSDMADAVVSVCTRFAWRKVGERLGYPPDGGPDRLSGFAVLAMGKLGSRDMRLGSDLDLVFVCGPDGLTTRKQSLYHFYTKVAQKLSNLLTAPTQFGRLYDLDHRLRPFGNKGVLVPGLEAYRIFLNPEGGGGVDIWNFQAFSRIRHIAGDPALAEELIAMIGEAWRARKDSPPDVARAVWDMLQRLVAEHGNPRAADGEVLPLKFAVGGMIGFEFLQQAYFLMDVGEARSGWTAPVPHEIIKRLEPDYAELGQLDERLSCYENDGRHEFHLAQVADLEAIGRRWRFEEVAARCKRMEEEIARAFRDLGV